MVSTCCAGNKTTQRDESTMQGQTDSITDTSSDSVASSHSQTLKLPETWPSQRQVYGERLKQNKLPRRKSIRDDLKYARKKQKMKCRALMAAATTGLS